MCEIVNPTKYINCHVPVTYLASGTTNNSLDGEEYVSDMCTNIIFQKLCTLTYEEIEALKGTEIDLSSEMCFPEYQQKMFDNTGAIITQLKVIIAEAAKGEGV